MIGTALVPGCPTGFYSSHLTLPVQGDRTCLLGDSKNANYLAAKVA